MSLLNHVSDPSSSKSDLTVEDENTPKKASLTKSIELVNRKWNFSQAFEDGNSTFLAKPMLGVPSEAFVLQSIPQPCENINLKTVPQLGAKDSLENIFRIGKYGEFPRRNLLRSFVKANSLERRPRRRLCQKKNDTIDRSIAPDILKSKTCPEVNVKKLRYQLAKERKVFNRFSIGRFGQNIRYRVSRGDALRGQFRSKVYQGSAYDEDILLCKDDTIGLHISSSNSKASRTDCLLNVQQLAVQESEFGIGEESQSLNSRQDEDDVSTEMLCSLESLNLNRKKCVSTATPESSETSRGTVEPMKNNSSLCLKDSLIEDRVHEKNSVERYNSESGSKLQEPNGKESRTTDSTKIRITDSIIDQQSCLSKVDFSSGDDTRNLCSGLTLDEVEGICGMACIRGKRNQDYESRRSVQWNSKVDVIYYAGDTNGGRVVHRKIEPLREEADQQARRNDFIKLALKRNLISALSTRKFQEPWVTVYHK